MTLDSTYKQSVIALCLAIWKGWQWILPMPNPLMEKRENVSVKPLSKKKQMKLTQQLNMPDSKFHHDVLILVQSKEKEKVKHAR